MIPTEVSVTLTILMISLYPSLTSDLLEMVCVSKRKTLTITVRPTVSLNVLPSLQNVFSVYDEFSTFFIFPFELYLFSDWSIVKKNIHSTFHHPDVHFFSFFFVFSDRSIHSLIFLLPGLVLPLRLLLFSFEFFLLLFFFSVLPFNFWWFFW